MKNYLKPFLEVLLLICFMAIPPLFVWMDFTILETNLSEYSLTEFSQEFLLLATFNVLFLKAKKSLKNKGFLTLLWGLFLVMFIREGDYFLDKIMDGLWQILAISTFLIAAYVAYKHKETITTSLSTYWDMKGFGYLTIGLLIVLFFSRIFGTGNLWRAILQENYSGLFKTAIQEGLELLGYLLIFIGSISISKNTTPDTL